MIKLTSNSTLGTSQARALVLCVLLMVSPVVRGEIYQGIEPNATLQEIKTRFPNADYQPIKAAWVTADQAFYLVTGTGLVGKLYVAFFDNRPTSFASMVDAKAAGHDDLAKFYRDQWEKSTEDSLTTSWVRWVPPAAIPIERFFLRYGKVAKVEFNNEDMSPYYQWKDRGGLASLSDDLKSVKSVEYTFTNAERLTTCKRKFDAKKCESFYSK